jgi:hypothetical protein
VTVELRAHARPANIPASIFDGTAWTTAPATLTVPRHALGAAVDLQGRLYAIGGYRGGEVNQVERLAP